MAEDSYVTVRIPKDLYDSVSSQAEREDRSVTGEVRRILKRAITEGQLQKAAA
jgi:hypothetical protein